MRTGVDLGGTKIEAIVLGPGGVERARRRTPTPRDDYAGIVAAVRDLVQAAEQEAAAERATLGVGIPGVISPTTGLVKNANTTCLIGRPLDRDLGAALGRPVRLANDANCFALSEATDGAGAGAALVFGAILGTGVGGGLVAHGRPIEGANAIAGEWGHNPLPWPDDDERPGPPCYCGRRGCIETFLSGPALAAAHGGGLAPTEIARRAEAGDVKAEATMRRYAQRLAKALASVLNLFDPDVVVLGGGLSNVARLYDDVPPLWAEYVFSDAVATRLRRAKHGDSSGVRGAAWLWPE
jgi:fructokinase